LLLLFSISADIVNLLLWNTFSSSSVIDLQITAGWIVYCGSFLMCHFVGYIEALELSKSVLDEWLLILIEYDFNCCKDTNLGFFLQYYFPWQRKRIPASYLNFLNHSLLKTNNSEFRIIICFHNCIVSCPVKIYWCAFSIIHTKYRTSLKV
jgi:hypothetical protein